MMIEEVHCTSSSQHVHHDLWPVSSLLKVCMKDRE